MTINDWLTLSVGANIMTIFICIFASVLMIKMLAILIRKEKQYEALQHEADRLYREYVNTYVELHGERQENK